MRKKLLIPLLVCISVYSFGQRSLGFTIYQNTDIFQVHYINLPSHQRTKESNVNFSRISLAVELLTKKGFVHEVEFMLPEFAKPLDKLKFPFQYYFVKSDLMEEIGEAYSLRYSFSKYLASKSDRLNFIFGAGINPYFVLQEYTPTTPHSYYTSLKWYGIALNLTPGMYYKPGRHFRLGLNVPFRIYNFRIEKHRQDNPILPIAIQRYTEKKHLFFEPAYTIRLGLTYRLTK